MIRFFGASQGDGRGKPRASGDDPEIDVINEGNVK